ncbi:hypothetical protein PFISCL1PPCAC_20505, partial [Pristionchus fissidentatus]
LFQTMDNGTVDYRSVDDSPQNEMEWRSANHNPVYNYNQVDHQPANYPISNHQKPFSQWTELTNCNAYSTVSHYASYSNPTTIYSRNEFSDRLDNGQYLEKIDVTSQLIGDEESDHPEEALSHGQESPKSELKEERSESWSYAALICLALKHSPTGRMTVPDIYKYILEHFPYYRTAPNMWKNCIRHKLSVSPKFKKIDYGEKRCEWTIDPESNPVLVEKMINKAMEKEVIENGRTLQQIHKKYEDIGRKLANTKIDRPSEYGSDGVDSTGSSCSSCSSPRSCSCSNDYDGCYDYRRETTPDDLDLARIRDKLFII